MTDPEDRQLEWRSRRGMLELELLLQPFVRTRLAGLDTGSKRLYARLLEQEDWDIFDWLQRRSEPEDEGLREIVASIRTALGTDPGT